MKKIFAVILALFMIFTFVACGSAEASPVEKGCARAAQIGQQYLDFEISKSEALAQLREVENLIRPLLDTHENYEDLKVSVQINSLQVSINCGDYNDVAAAIANLTD